MRNTTFDETTHLRKDFLQLSDAARDGKTLGDVFLDESRDILTNADEVQVGDLDTSTSMGPVEEEEPRAGKVAECVEASAAKSRNEDHPVEGDSAEPEGETPVTAGSGEPQEGKVEESIGERPKDVGEAGRMDEESGESLLVRLPIIPHGTVAQPATSRKPRKWELPAAPSTREYIPRATKEPKSNFIVGFLGSLSLERVKVNVPVAGGENFGTRRKNFERHKIGLGV
jgi:hypothetical protein